MSQSQILINQMSYSLSTGNVLFNKLNLAFSQHKSGLIGRNGVGKSTLIKLILGEIFPQSGSILTEGKLVYLPQSLNISLDISVASFFGVEEKFQNKLSLFGLENIPFDRPLKLLSGGEITKLLLTKTFSSDADFLLLDEPTNHLDYKTRHKLYNAIIQWKRGLIVVSHDRALLNLMEEIIEITSLGANSFGGNYDDYEKQKNIITSVNEQRLCDAKKLLQKNKSTIQDSREKHEKRKSYGIKLKRSGSIDKMAAGSKKGRSERTQSSLLIKNERLMDQAENQLKLAKDKIEISEAINVDLAATTVPNGKVILEIEDLNFSYPNTNHILFQHFNFEIHGPKRVALMGDNGSGKTTLIKLILGQLEKQEGKIFIGTEYVSYLDQNASLLNPDLSVLDNFLLLNSNASDNDGYRCLAQFLFRNVSARKIVRELSGGERLRALLACVLMSDHPPQLLILDEPTNHLDLNSIKSIESALKNYLGAMIVVSHDEKFLENIGINQILRMC